MSWEHYIDNQFELTDSDFQEYFRFKYRGGYYVQMKREVCRYMIEKGYTTLRIAELLYGNKERHDAVCHHLHHSKHFHKRQLVQDSWREWIKDGLYPISSEVGKYGNNERVFYQMDFKLIHRSELTIK